LRLAFSSARIPTIAAGCAVLLLLGAGRAQAAAVQPDFLGLAKQGIAAAHKGWWNARLGWYDDRLDKSWRPTAPLAYLWSAFPLFEAVDAVALAQPSAANRAAVRTFANAAERYWNPALRPVGGYAYYMGTHTRNVHTYFDDNGWWGLAFVDAFRATGDRRYLRDAARAFRFIVRSGWDSEGGGIWWDTSHDHKTAEPLAAAAFIGAVIYGATHDPTYLEQVTRLLNWADAHSWNSAAHLYGRSDTDGTVLDYVEGMMIGADLELCKATGAVKYCQKAEQLGQAAVQFFPSTPDWSATADGLYLRFLLDLYRYDGNRQFYDLVSGDAMRAISMARDAATGFYLRSWTGRSVAPPGLLRTHAGTVALLAWLAVARPPHQR
jgi:hypothetical protein